MTHTTRIDPAIGILACPVCRERLDRDDSRLVCPQRHSFDLARQGYVNLLQGPPPRNADTPTMLEARTAIQRTTLFARAAEAIAERAEGTCVEVGAGTGYYLAATRAQRHLATDISVAAAKRCAGAGLASAVADTWAVLPILDGVVDTVLCVFAPRNPSEFVRILARGGRAIVITPQPRHLESLRQSLGLIGIAPRKDAALDATMSGAGLVLQDSITLNEDHNISTADALHLVGMGPNAFHGFQDHLKNDLSKTRHRFDKSPGNDGQTDPMPADISDKATIARNGDQPYTAEIRLRLTMWLRN